MAVRRILRMGHPLLRQAARPLSQKEITSDDTARLVADMVDTLKDYGGIGLAAPQIAESVRIAIIEVDGGETRYGKVPELPLTIFFNPEITVGEGATTKGYWEGCLSVPGLRGFVERPQHVRVDYLDIKARRQSLELRGFLATVLQHEFDHLDGRLFIDRMTDMRQLAFDTEFERYLAPRSSDSVLD